MTMYLWLMAKNFWWTFWSKAPSWLWFCCHLTDVCLRSSLICSAVLKSFYWHELHLEWLPFRSWFSGCVCEHMLLDCVLSTWVKEWHSVQHGTEQHAAQHRALGITRERVVGGHCRPFMQSACVFLERWDLHWMHTAVYFLCVCVCFKNIKMSKNVFVVVACFSVKSSTCVCVHAHAYTCTCAHTHTHTHTPYSTHSLTHTRTHTHPTAHAHTHPTAHAHTHSHTHTYSHNTHIHFSYLNEFHLFNTYEFSFVLGWKVEVVNARATGCVANGFAGCGGGSGGTGWGDWSSRSGWIHFRGCNHPHSHRIMISTPGLFKKQFLQKPTTTLFYHAFYSSAWLFVNKHLIPPPPPTPQKKVYKST